MKYGKLISSATILIALVFVSCKQEKTITLTVKEPSAANALVMETHTIKVKFTTDGSSISYNNYKAIQYAKQWAGQNNNSCGVYNNDPSQKLSDCAHFLSHCLAAGGITINQSQPNNAICPDGLCYRVKELTSALDSLSKIYDNVKSIDMHDAIVGDYGFFNFTFLNKPTHGFMICTPAASLDDITIYAHTTNRNCEKPTPNWYQFFGSAYRITDN
jgi:hypothetical protein